MYSGVGGWSLGLKLAGIEVVASYERWAIANETNFLNNKHVAHTVDIRRLSLDQLPNEIDIVVGSPPCTQFSFANRGGTGDIEDGLEDIKCFLRIVDHLKPRYWAMENVSRVATIIQREAVVGGRLEEFRHLPMTMSVLNMEKFGLPQRRQRCIVGNFNFDLLNSYQEKLAPVTLGEVVTSLSQVVITDPLYGITLNKSDLHDHEEEVQLNEEEIRINQAAKLHHPIYNAMPFPDPIVRSARTITATCTRVSRESIIIQQPARANVYRRLTVRERACLQGFPITFQFYGETYTQKLRMVGNAVPPTISYLIGQAMMLTHQDELPHVSDRIRLSNGKVAPPTRTPPHIAGRQYPSKRTFRFAVPNFHFKSGVRFELANSFEIGQPVWSVRLYFGTPKSIHILPLDPESFISFKSFVSINLLERIDQELERLSSYLSTVDVERMQDVWCHAGPGGTRPFTLLDKISEAGTNLAKNLSFQPSQSTDAIAVALTAHFGTKYASLLGVSKLHKNASAVHAGMLIGALTNKWLSTHVYGHATTPRKAKTSG